MKEELVESRENREAMDDDSFNLEQCMTANASLINENKGLEADKTILKNQVAELNKEFHKHQAQIAEL